MKKITIIVAMLILKCVAFAQAPLKNDLTTVKKKTSIEKIKNDLSEISPFYVKQPNSKSGSRAFTLLYQFPVKKISEAGVETDGQFVYTSKWSAPMFYKYDLTGNIVDSFSITGLTQKIRDLAYDGRYFYGGSAGSNIYKMDFTNRTLVATIPTPAYTLVRHISINPADSSFYCGNYTTIHHLSKTGTFMDSISASGHQLTSMYGGAYDSWSPGGPYLWMNDQAGSGDHMVKISIATSSQVGLPFDVQADLGLSSGTAGGLFCLNNAGTVILGGLVQGKAIFAYNITAYSSDAGVTAYTSPSNSTCTHTASEVVTVSVTNFGSATITSAFQVAYKLNGGTEVTANVPVPLATGASVDVSFPVVDLSAVGTYQFVAYTKLSGDMSSSNDSAHYSTVSSDAQLTIKITTDQYGSETTWTLRDAQNGTVVAQGGPFTDLSTAGVQLYEATACVIAANCYAFTVYDAYGDGMNTTYGAGGYELVWGTTSLGGFTPGTFTDSALVTGICQPSAIDVGVLSYTTPLSGCGLTTGSVSVHIKNFGLNAVSNITVIYSLNGGAAVSTAIAGPINSGDTVLVAFTQQENLSIPGAFSFTTYTALAGDGNLSNDTLDFTINHITPVIAPYAMGFEGTEDLNGMFIEDVNNDGTSWGVYTSALYAHTGTNLAAYSYTSANAANDWIYTKCIDLNAGTNYQLNFWYRAAGITYPENLLAAIGSAQTASAMTTTLIDLVSIIDTVYNDTAKVFTVPTTGTYYLGFKAYSAANMYNIYLDDISIAIATSIKETSNASETTIYPNPVKNNVHVVSTETIMSVKLINAIGQTVVNEDVNSKSTSINTSSLVRGIYFVKVQTNNGTTTKRISIIE